MPLVRISLVKGKPAEYRRKVGDAIHRALFGAIAANLGRAVGLRPQDAWVNLVEVAKENWSFGNGEASYAPPSVAHPAHAA
jgi:phenylpyruvate tautomerase PptA (4-oxalocrotonate tautomerase family)